MVTGRKTVGRVSSAVWSPDFDCNVAIGMVRMTHWDPGTRLQVDCPDGLREATVCLLPHGTPDPES